VAVVTSDDQIKLVVPVGQVSLFSLGISFCGGQLRSGDVKRGSALTDKAFDQDMHFMLFEVAGDQLYFQVISRTGETVDAGVLPNQKKKK